MTSTQSHEQIQAALSIEASEAREVAKAAKNLSEKLSKWPGIYQAVSTPD